MKAWRELFKTELKLSIRDMNMVIFAIAMPLVVIVLMGIIFGGKPAHDGASYTFMQQSFGAVSTIAICAGGVMGLPIAISDYRSKKILKRFWVTPTSPSKLLLAQLAVYATYAVISLLLTFATSVLFFGYRMDGNLVIFSGAYLLVMISIFSIGVMVGGLAPNTKWANVIASLLYFPMLIFSGATLPYEVMPKGLQLAADAMPLTQGIKLLKAASLGQPVQNVWLPVVILVGVATVCIGIGIRFFKWE